jgi:MFS family permease
MFTELPIFLTRSLGYRVDEAGGIAAIPWLALAILVYVTGLISDRLTLNHSTGYVRKLIMSICKKTTCHRKLFLINFISFSFYYNCIGFTYCNIIKYKSSYIDYYIYYNCNW